jgi:endonuclease III
MYRRNKNVPALLRALHDTYPDTECALTHENPLQLIVATILSAQCTDERVNMVTPALFKRCRTAKDFATIPPKELEKLIHSTGFYRNKSKNIRGMAQMLLDRHGGQVPQTMDELLELPGVARKTANVVLSVAYNKAEGIVVDTHVARLSRRFGLSQQENPVKIEQELMKLIPKEDWIWFSGALIDHGRKVCKAISPRCPECPLVHQHCANPPDV